MARTSASATAAPLSPGTMRRHVLSGAAITALGGLLSGRTAVHRQGLPRADVLRQGAADQHPADWGANFVVTVSFLTLLSAIGNAGPFFLFAGMSIVALVYFQRQVP